MVPSKQSTAFLALFFLLTGVVVHPTEGQSPPESKQVSRPKEETLSDLMKKLKVQLALDKYEDDFGSLLSKILEKSARWKERGIVKGHNGSRDKYVSEQKTIQMTVGKERVRLDAMSEVTYQDSHFGGTLTCEDSLKGGVKTKRIDKILVLPYDGGRIRSITTNVESEVYEIDLIVTNDAKAATIEKVTRFVGVTGSDYDPRLVGTTRVSTDHNDSVDIHVACSAEDAVAIGRAFKKLIERERGTVSIVDYTKK